MNTRDVSVDDPLEDFSTWQFEFGGESKKVYLAGAGPAVIVMPEVPGISPPVARFARWVRDAGFRVYMPSLFGRDGAVVDAEEGAAVLQRLCISAEFSAMQSGRSSKVTHWVRALARHAHAECGGPGVGAVGMCFTGNFALTMMLDSALIAPVLAQPALPLNDPGGLEISPEELSQVRSRMDREGLKVVGLRFRDDPLCTAARFTAYQNALGEHFEGIVLPDEAANKDVAPFVAKYVSSPHSVLTQNLIDKEGEPTLKVRDQVLEFLKQRLQA
ncbi:dienelactone hydrolase family protein [Paraburkholderia caribensis]|uniref:dienelactone hydrolase family protein n=1 Tax=Paraburkholderia caribensis TaxID=75105 RepID=UPI00285F6E92|nr:dienelactone hydrolase family protein [Paraburkholderia caribensis]MDR6382134.1 dienelactone hydrolase [Paraburkholderia caribensis]